MNDQDKPTLPKIPKPSRLSVNDLSEADIIHLATQLNADPEKVKQLIQEKQSQELIKNNAINMLSINERKLKIREWIRENPDEYKQFIKEEYKYVYKMKTLSKKVGKIATGLLISLMILGLYEAAILLTNIPLPSILLRWFV